MVVRKRELDGMRDDLLLMAALVETAIGDSVKALVNRDSELARKVVEGDREINTIDVRIDEECIRMLALYQPMATELRLITTAMKVTTDLERIGDNAANIAQRALELNNEPILKPYVDIPHMGRIAGAMVRDAIEAFVNKDKRLALDVIQRDDEIDDLNEAIFEELSAYMMRDPATVLRAMKVTHISKYLERIADHATNIAEMVVYFIEGKIIRHTV